MQRWWWVGLMCVAGVGACVGTDTDGAPDAGGDAAVDGPRPVFDALTLEEPEDRFFDFPFPSTLRTYVDGHPDFAGFPYAQGLVADTIAVIEVERPGWSGAAPTYLRFTEAVDMTTLPASPAASVEPGSLVMAINIDPASPEHGRRYPVFVSFHAEADLYYPGHLLSVRPVPGVTLPPGTEHAVVVRRGLRAADGTEMLGEPAFEALKTAEAEGPVAAHYAHVFDSLEAVGVHRDDVLVATAFRTSDPALEMENLHAAIEDATASTPSWTSSPVDRGAYIDFRGTFETLEFFSGEAPYEAFGDGVFRFGPDGEPLDVTTRSVQFALSVPKTATPEGGFPLVVYGHGTGGSELSHLGVNSAGTLLGPQGIAVLGFEAAFHGSRADGTALVDTLLFTNPPAAREMVRQTVADTMLVLRMVRDGLFDIPGAVTGGGAVPFNPNPAMYMGHSQGSQQAGLLIGVEPTLQGAFLSAGGGGALIPVFQRRIPDEDGALIACLLAPLVSIYPCEAFTPDHPVALLVQMLLDPADPLHFARRAVLERSVTAAPLSIAMTEGTGDPITPPDSIEALAAAIGLPLMEPVVRTSLPYDLLALDPKEGPVTGNLGIPGGRMATGALMQWDGGDHFVAFEEADAQTAYVEFFRTLVDDGIPTLPAR